MLENKMQSKFLRLGSSFICGWLMYIWADVQCSTPFIVHNTSNMYFVLNSLVYSIVNFSYVLGKEFNV